MIGDIAVITIEIEVITDCLRWRMDTGVLLLVLGCYLRLHVQFLCFLLLMFGLLFF